MSRPLPKPLRGALLDLDGTLVDTEHFHLISANEVLGGFGHELGLREFSRFIGWAEEPFWEALRERFRLDAATADLAARREKSFVRLLHTASIDPLPGVREVLRLLAQHGVPCAIASSSTRREIEAMLDAAGIRDQVAAVRSGHDDVSRGKPHPDVYLAAAEALGVEAAACLALEDSSTGVQAARAAGAFTVAVPCPSHPDPDLGAADLRLDSLEELPPLIGGSLAGPA